MTTCGSHGPREGAEKGHASDEVDDDEGVDGGRGDPGASSRVVVGRGGWIEHAEGLRIALIGLPVMAAFLVAYLAPHRKVVLGLSMGVLGALLGVVAMSVYQKLGYHVDQIGGPLATFGVLLAIHLAYAAAGTAAGYFVWRIRSRQLGAPAPQ